MSKLYAQRCNVRCLCRGCLGRVPTAPAFLDGLMWEPPRTSLSKSCEEAGSEWQSNESNSEDERTMLVGL
eukprot:8209888-Lingulodinium_polyedra.AAC.1